MCYYLNFSGKVMDTNSVRHNIQVVTHRWACNAVFVCLRLLDRTGSTPSQEDGAAMNLNVINQNGVDMFADKWDNAKNLGTTT